MVGTCFEHVALCATEAWSSPFARWQGPLQDTSSVDLAVDVTSRALSERSIEPRELGQIVLGWTVPQLEMFYGAPTVAARIGAPRITGPMVSQACATSVAGLAVAAGAVEGGAREPILVLMTDRTSNGPHLVYPSPSGPGGAPRTETWVLANFARDPWAGTSMVETAEAVATEGGMSRAQIDEAVLLRHAQYREALADDRSFQRGYMVDAVVKAGKTTVTVDADTGIHDTSEGGLRQLEPSVPGGVVTHGAQTHPADGVAGAVVRSRRDVSGPVVRLLSVGFARVEPARMPKAPVPAAHCALNAARIDIGSIDLVTTHNPFIVSDIWFSQQMRFPLDRMNVYGSSLVYGHPQAPTGLRAIIELTHALLRRGGGTGLFTGCAAGDTAGAVVIRVDDGTPRR